tara:strand:+ start:80 stop:1180 length:1101 start_codon:yes stop_codon:yes gene_type:complete
MVKKVKVGPYILDLEMDADDLSKKYKDWVKKCTGLSGETIGVRSKTSLFDFIKNQGSVGRVVFDKESPDGRETQQKSNMGGSIFIPMLDTFYNKMKFEPNDAKQLQDIYTTLLSNSDDNSSQNPRNMAFNGIKSYSRKPIIRNGKPLKDKRGNERHTVINITVFGHYRTPKYVEYRNKIKKLNEFEGHESWYASTKPNKSEPPMWQALYAKKEGNLNIKLSLIQIVEETMESLKNAKGKVSNKTPITIKGQGTADAVYRGISDVKSFFDKVVLDSTYKTKKGNFNVKKVQDWFAANPIPLDTNSEETLMKKIMESIDASYPINITEVPLRISPLMIKRIAGLAGFQPPVKETEEVKKMSWMEVLVR